MAVIFSSVVSPSMDYKVITAGKLLTDKTTVSVVFQTIEDANANGMSFTRRGVERSLQEAKQDVIDRKMLGELDHPDLDPTDERSIQRLATVMYQCSSHVITELDIDGKFVVGKFETLSTPNGQILAALLNDKIKTGVSIRAITEEEADYDPNSLSTINNYKLVTYDAVHNPAYKESYVNSILSFKYHKEFTNEKEIIKLTRNELSEMFAIFAKQLTENIHKQMKGLK